MNGEGSRRVDVSRKRDRTPCCHQSRVVTGVAGMAVEVVFTRMAGMAVEVVVTAMAFLGMVVRARVGSNGGTVGTVGTEIMVVSKVAPA